MNAVIAPANGDIALPIDRDGVVTVASLYRTRSVNGNIVVRITDNDG
jgi:hypothetical protein